MILNFSDSLKQPSNTIEVPNGNLVTDYTTDLIGLGSWFQYGDDVNSNVVRLLERSAYSNPPITPIQGELWYNPDTSTLYCATTLIPYRPAEPADPPTVPFPLPEQPEVLEWKGLGEPWYQTSPPLSEDVLWFDENIEQLKIFIDGSWVSVAEQYLLLSGGTMTGDLQHDATLEIQTETSVNDFNITSLNSINIPSIEFVSQYRTPKFTTDGNNQIVLLNTDVDQPGSMWPQYTVFYSTESLTLSSQTPSAVSLQIGNTEILRIGSSLVRLKAPVDANQQKITGVGSSSVTSSAVPLSDLTNVEQQWEADLINVSGDATTGTLTVPSAILRNNAASHDFIAVQNFLLNATSTTFTIKDQTSQSMVTIDYVGTVDAHANRLQNGQDPVDDSDGVTKKYADDQYDNFEQSIQNSTDEKAVTRAWAEILRPSYDPQIVTTPQELNILTVTKDTDNVYNVYIDLNSVDAPASLSEIMPIVGTFDERLETLGWGRYRWSSSIVTPESPSYFPDSINPTSILIPVKFERRTVGYQNAGLGDTSLETIAITDPASSTQLPVDVPLTLAFYW